MEKPSREVFASGFLAARLASLAPMIKIFTPSFADEADTNAQNLSAKEIVARLDPARAAVTMFHEGAWIRGSWQRPNTTLLRWRQHGKTLGTS